MPRKRSRANRVPKEMIVQEVEMPAGKPGNFGKRVVHDLRVERAASREKTILVAEGAMMGTASRDDNRVRDQIPVSLNKVSPYGRQRFQSTHRRLVTALWRSCREVLQELREGVLSGSDKDCVCVRRRSSGSDVT